MLETLIVILVLFWLLGMGTGYVAGGLLHLLLIVAVVILIIRLLPGRGNSL